MPVVVIAMKLVTFVACTLIAWRLYFLQMANSRKYIAKNLKALKVFIAFIFLLGVTIASDLSPVKWIAVSVSALTALVSLGLAVALPYIVRNAIMKQNAIETEMTTALSNARGGHPFGEIDHLLEGLEALIKTDDRRD